MNTDENIPKGFLSIMKGLASIILSLLSVIIVVAAAFGVGYYFGVNSKAETQPSKDSEFDLKLPTETEKKIVTAHEVETKLAEMSELTTYAQEYTVTQSVDYTRFLIDKIPIPGTTNSITLTCQGIVKVGYDIEDIRVRVDNESSNIYISLPDAAVNDNYIIWDTLECDERNNLLNPIDFEQYRSLVEDIEQEGLEQAEQSGIYDAAENHLKLLITHFLSGFDDYEVIFL